MTEAADAPAAQPQRTELYEEHAKLGATFTDFGGWDMPLKYGSELAEHRSVREAAGLFDLSHMGEIWVGGPEAVAFMNTALVGDFSKLRIGKAKYSVICDERGGIIDDLISYRLAEHQFLVVPNAGNAPVVARVLAERAAGFDVTVTDASAETSLIALQGPASEQVLIDILPAAQHAALRDLPYYAAIEATVADTDVLLARTGYTGEDGFELYVPNESATELWRQLLEAGDAHGLLPAGLAARDSLRLEAGMPLYGNELSRETTPFEAGLGPIVSFAKPEPFVGREALERVKQEGPNMVLVGLRGLGRRAGRGGYTVHAGDAVVGRITSGQPSPTLGYPIALAYVEPEYVAVGTPLTVDLRGKMEQVEVVALPFYRRPA